MEPRNTSPHLSGRKTEETKPMDKSHVSDSGWQSVTNKRSRKRGKEVASCDYHDIQPRAQSERYLAKRDNTSRPSQMKGWRGREESSVQEIKMNRNEQICTENDVRVSSSNCRKREKPASRMGYSQQATNTVGLKLCDEEKSEIWPKMKSGQSAYRVSPPKNDESRSQEWPKLGRGHSSRKSTECKQDFSFAGRLSGNCQNKEYCYQSTYKDKDATESQTSLYSGNYQPLHEDQILHQEKPTQKEDKSAHLHPELLNRVKSVAVEQEIGNNERAKLSKAHLSCVSDPAKFSESSSKPKPQEAQSVGYGAVRKTDYNWQDREAAVKLDGEPCIKKRENENLDQNIFMPNWKKVENTELEDTSVVQYQSPQNSRPGKKKEEREETVYKLQDELNVTRSERLEQQPIGRPHLVRIAGQDTKGQRTSVSNKETMPSHSNVVSFEQVTLEKDVINNVKAEVMKSTNESKNEVVEKILLPKQDTENNWRTEQPSKMGHTDWSNFNKRSLPTWREDQVKNTQEQKVCSSYSKQHPVDTPSSSDKFACQAASFKSQTKTDNQENQQKFNSWPKKKDNKHHEVLTDFQKRKSFFTENCESNVYTPPHVKNGYKPSQARMKLEGEDFPPLHNTGKWLPSAKISANKNSDKAYVKDKKCPHLTMPCGTTGSISKAVKTRKKQPKAKDPIFWNIIEIAKPLSAIRQCQKHKKPKRVGQVVCIGGNMLDSSNPIRKRGKHRELPKMKRPTRLKSIILHERLRRKAAKKTLKPDLTKVVFKSNSEASGSKMLNLDKNISKGSAEIEGEMETTQSKACTSSNEEATSHHEDSVVKLALHSGKFREYCENTRSPQLDAAVITLITKLLTYQTKKHESDPTQAHSKRRLVFGMREVNKYLTLKKMKMIVIAPDLENVPAKGGLNDAVVKIKEEASKQIVPVIFATNRRKLGYATFKKVPVSIVGIANFEGAEEFHQEVVKNWQCAVEEYQRDYQTMRKLLFPACDSSKGTDLHPEEPALTSVDQVKMISETCLSKLRDK